MSSPRPARNCNVWSGGLGSLGVEWNGDIGNAIDMTTQTLYKG